MRQYHKELQEWKDEKEQQEVEFTITDRKVKVRRLKWTSYTPISLTGAGTEVVV
jgi:hypothetical protein